jgi:hypothetical protein
MRFRRVPCARWSVKRSRRTSTRISSPTCARSRPRSASSFGCSARSSPSRTSRACTDRDPGARCECSLRASERRRRFHRRRRSNPSHPWRWTWAAHILAPEIRATIPLSIFPPPEPAPVRLWIARGRPSGRARPRSRRRPVHRRDAGRRDRVRHVAVHGHRSGLAPGRGEHGARAGG